MFPALPPVDEAAEAAALEQEARRRAELRAILDSGRRVRVALVGCGSAKRRGRHPARQLYTGGLFRGASAHAFETADAVFIVSAKYGLLEPDQVVEHYNVRLPRARDERRCWGTRVESALRLQHVGIPLRVAIYAGSAYADAIAEASWRNNWIIEQPLRGLGVGKRLQWLADRRRDRQTALPLLPSYP